MVRRFLLTALLAAATLAHTQSLGDVQVHGFATQGFLYSTQDNYLTKRSSDGDAGWTEAVLSISDSPTPRLRVGIQLHYFRLGEAGSDAPTIDWALGDYKVNDYFGVRAGKVKTPIGLFNDIQDIDAVVLWSLLPQSMYQIDNRSFYLAHYGGEIYGAIPLGQNGSKLIYRVYGGQNSLSKTQGYTRQLSTLTGLVFPDAISGPMTGADIRWQTPVRPLLLGASIVKQYVSGIATTGSASLNTLLPVYYAQYDNGRFYAAGEYRRQPSHGIIQIGPVVAPLEYDERQWYAMTSFRITDKFQIGSYYSHQVVANTPKYQQSSSSKDLVFSSRYDFNPFFYAKAEDHFLHGTAIGFYNTNNPLGTRSRTNVVILKLGFYF